MSSIAPRWHTQGSNLRAETWQPQGPCQLKEKDRPKAVPVLAIVFIQAAIAALLLERR
jgi:hypothetical protein